SRKAAADHMAAQRKDRERCAARYGCKGTIAGRKRLWAGGEVERRRGGPAKGRGRTSRGCARRGAIDAYAPTRTHVEARYGTRSQRGFAGADGALRARKRDAERDERDLLRSPRESRRDGHTS